MLKKRNGIIVVGIILIYGGGIRVSSLWRSVVSGGG